MSGGTCARLTSCDHCLSPSTRTARSEKADHVRQAYASSEHADNLEVVVVEDLTTSDLTSAFQGASRGGPRFRCCRSGPTMRQVSMRSSTSVRLWVAPAVPRSSYRYAICLPHAQQSPLDDAIGLAEHDLRHAPRPPTRLRRGPQENRPHGQRDQPAGHAHKVDETDAHRRRYARASDLAVPALPQPALTHPRRRRDPQIGAP